MSTAVTMKLFLLATKGILPRNLMIRVFEECIKEMGLTLTHGVLTDNKGTIGRIAIKDRITLTIPQNKMTEYNSIIEKIRSAFAFKARIEQDNHIRNQKLVLERKIRDQEAHADLMKSIEQEQAVMEKALKRQEKDCMQAIKEEIIEAAINNGFEVEQSVDSNKRVQLQLVRREY